jgi:hypothetical protein
MWHSNPRFQKTSAGDSFCSATAAALRWNFLEIKRLACQTPPAPGGTKAAQFPHFSEAGKHAGLPNVSWLPN